MNSKLQQGREAPGPAPEGDGGGGGGRQGGQVRKHIFKYTRSPYFPRSKKNNLWNI